MGAAEPVKLVAFVLFADEEAFRAARLHLESTWGTVDYEGGQEAFDLTDYYEQEMGPGLKRTVLAFAELISPDEIVRAKQKSTSIEDDLRSPRGRRVNIDMGYLDTHKLVLASSKPGAPKIYLGEGVYADPVARYSKGAFRYEAWTFADFRERRHEQDLLRIRQKYKSARRQ